MRTSVLELPGVGAKYKKLLSFADIEYIEQLQSLDSPSQLGRVSKISGIPTYQVEKLYNKSKLLKVDKVSLERIDLLNAAGISSVEELKKTQPKRLTKTLFFLNEKEKYVEQVPMLKDIMEMVESANKLY